MAACLAETDTGIEQDALAGNAGPQRRVGARRQEFHHFGGDVLVTRCQLHGFRRALHVHQHDACTTRRDDIQHPRIGRGGHVIDDVGAGIERSGRHGRRTRIDTDCKASRQFPAQCPDDGQHSRQLLRLGHRQCARASAFAPDIDDRRTLVQHQAGVRECVGQCRVTTTVRKAVRRDIEHAHHDRYLCRIGQAPEDARFSHRA